MMKISEEQKVILNLYEGGRTKVIRQMKDSLEELQMTGENPEVLSEDGIPEE